MFLMLFEPQSSKIKLLKSFYASTMFYAFKVFFSNEKLITERFQLANINEPVVKKIRGYH